MHSDRRQQIIKQKKYYRIHINGHFRIMHPGNIRQASQALQFKETYIVNSGKY